MNGNSWACKEDCYLHLNSHSSSHFGPFYSTDSAIGILIGTGNVGKHLSTREDEQHTFISRDAG